MASTAAVLTTRIFLRLPLNPFQELFVYLTGGVRTELWLKFKEKRSGPPSSAASGGGGTREANGGSGGRS
eukprot:CAMPEP_0170482410 /NCGR_PEP_ID=MMETSP0208-20121228/2442_1 /TAXON_ID=197538 /ORGANISM="Strombidium inclinatum, Strain S3" /LENGTH=69 /DNA_ID=CAMNT_0010755249 /DNA_START=46 /DNA_END=255 /DNA_ORIENTATION=+